MKKKYIYFVLDMMAVIISVFVAVLLRFDFYIPSSYHQFILYFTPVVLILTTIFSFAFRSYQVVLRFFGFFEMFKQFVISFCVCTVLLLVKFTGIFAGDTKLPGSIIVLFCLAFFALSCAVRGITRFTRFFQSLRALKEGKTKRALIIGGGKAGAMVIKQMLNTTEDGYFPIGIMDDDTEKHGHKVAGVKVLGSIDQTKLYAEQLQADEILICLLTATKDELATIFDLVSNANLPTKIFQSVVDIEKYSQGDRRGLREINIEDLLFRDSVKADNSLNRELIEGKVVVVTGGAGSIGSELCRQVLQNNPKFLVIIDINENGLFDLNEEVKGEYEGKYITCLGSIRDPKRLKTIFNQYKPQLVFHAAAHKHVPMMEINPFEAIKNNVVGTHNLVKQVTESKCEKFIQISTDKAVNPTNVMGATKRICELIVKSYSNDTTQMVAVRFGNVLGSNGSVIPLFKKQIAHGGPVTVTHKEMTRYFMTIPEAVSLVLSAGASAKGSELFVLDMGTPVKIYDLAVNLIRMLGYKPFEDIEIKVTGLRPGEKMYEELNLGSEIVDKTSHEKIFIMRDAGVNKDYIVKKISEFEELINEQKDEKLLRETLFGIIKENS